MDVSVLYKRAQRWLYRVARPAVFGNGMLERARATSLALLGFTAAVGLAIVALAANQGWPLIAGSSIPQIPPRHQAVGPAAVVASVESPAAGAAADRDPDGRDGAAGRGGGGASPVAPAPAPSAELVVSPSVPTGQGGGQSPDSPGRAPTPTAQPPHPATNAPDSTAAAPAPPAQAPPATEPSSPATSSEAPPAESESNVPPWSHGKGHAYGRSSDVDSDWRDHDDDWDDDSDDWDDNGDDWHDHGHGHDHDD